MMRNFNGWDEQIEMKTKNNTSYKCYYKNAHFREFKNVQN